MSIIRKRSASHKTFITGNIRDNQYILAEFPLTDELIEHLSSQHDFQLNHGYNELYQYLSNTLFECCQSFEMANGQFIACDKLIRVRFNEEMHQWQTNQQILFYYNPQYHSLKKAFYDPEIKANKISLLFLSSGHDIRLNAAQFHAKVIQVLNAYCQRLNLEKQTVRLRDHQHLTYDLCAKQKGFELTQVHKLRTIRNRYACQQVELPEEQSAMTYAIINVPVTPELIKASDIDTQAIDPYNPLYCKMAKTFTKASQRFNLNNAAMIANGLVPIIRFSPNQTISQQGELQMLGYNPSDKPCGIMSWWNANELVDNIQLVFIASKEDQTEYGYGRFLNHINAAMNMMLEGLAIEPSSDDVTVRFHQHIAYNLS